MSVKVRAKSEHALVCEALLCVRKLAQLMPNHVLCDRDRNVVLSIMHKEPDSAKVRQSVLRTEHRPTPQNWEEWCMLALGF